MAIYDFNFEKPRSTVPESKSFQGDESISIDRHQHTPDLSPQSNIAEVVDGGQNVSPEEVIQVCNKGFYRLDEGMLHWLEGMRIPVGGTYKIAKAYMVSHDKSTLSWARKTLNSRVELPVVSIKRKSWNFDKNRYIPPYIPYHVSFTDKTMTRAIQHFMPIPFDVNYDVAIWGKTKSDVEYIDSQITTRCSPLGEFILTDERNMAQMVRIKYGGTTSSADTDVGAKSDVKVVYNLSLEVEYALAINEKIVPTILGNVVVLEDTKNKEVFDVYRDDDLNRFR